MKHLSFLPMILLGALCAYAAPQDSPETLYRTAVRHEKRGRLEEARTNLLWLASYYAESPLATRARDEIGAIHLFEDGQARERDGRYGSATVTFRALAQVYPESPLAKEAEAASRRAERKQEQNDGPVVRSLTFRNTAPVTAKQILDRFKEREVGLAVDQSYRDDDIDEARKVLAELLAEKGVRNADVRAEVRPMSGNRVKIEFSVR
jgi:outer membrane protein assembly factor BamD (BamD/ComL family)